MRNRADLLLPGMFTMTMRLANKKDAGEKAVAIQQPTFSMDFTKSYFFFKNEKHYRDSDLIKKIYSNDSGDWEGWKYYLSAYKVRKTTKHNDSAIKSLAKLSFSSGVEQKMIDSTVRALDSMNDLEETAGYSNAYDQWITYHDLQFCPARNSVLAQLYFGEYSDNVVQSLKNGFLNFTPYGGLIYSELVSGYAGPFRVSFGGMIASSSMAKLDSTSIKSTSSGKQLDSLIGATDSVNRARSSIQNLLGGGGNAMFVISTPLFNYHPGKIFNISGAWFDKNCFTIPSFGNEISNYSFVNGLGLQLDGRFMFEGATLSSSSAKTTFGVYLSGTGTLLMGNKAFYTNLGTNPAKVLAFGQLSFGVILERFKIYFTYNVINDNSLQVQMPNCIGVNLTPF